MLYNGCVGSVSVTTEPLQFMFSILLARRLYKGEDISSVISPELAISQFRSVLRKQSAREISS
jgi:hypothetical protein